MQRALALLLIPTLMTMAGLASRLHTHVYTGHDHPEHHHDLAAHAHPPGPGHSHDETAQLASCVPGDHAVTLHLLCATASHTQTVGVESALSIPLVLAAPTARVMSHTDVRVHGPPSRAQTPPRGPPLINLT